MKSKFLVCFLFLITATYTGYGQEYNFTEAAQPQGKTIIFRFVGDNDTFYIPWQGNGEKLDELVATVNHYKKLVTDGAVKIDVAGYSSFYATVEENLKSAGVRANRVKSELIIRNGIEESDFHTTVYALPYEGWKSVVVVTLRVPQIQPPVAEVKTQPKPEPAPQPQPQRGIVEEQVVMVEEQTPVEIVPQLVKEARPNPYCFAMRTNLLYDAFLLPTLGVEWRISDRYGIKLDGSLAQWGRSTGKIQKMWMLNPEVRYYMGDARRFYAGVSGNYGKYNIYKCII